jgi:hypothetical protein
MIAIGLPIVGIEQEIINGERDNGLRRIGEWLKKISPRPVFLRIGYEFEGSHNDYFFETYVPAFQYIHNFFDSMDIKNVAYVWQSTGSGLSLDDHLKWYPGDEYVDWCAYSHFIDPDENMIEFARSKHKPVFIAESTPFLKKSDEFVTYPEQAKRMWEEWFLPFFKIIEDNPDIVKAFSYINVDWHVQPMWAEGMFSRCDSRIQKSDYISNLWRQKIKEERYLNATDINWNNLK